jgi:hypothetical protein
MNAHAFVVKSDPILDLAEGKSVDIRWVSRAGLNDISSGEVFDNIKEVYNFIFDEAVKDWESVETDSFLLDFPDEYK